MIGYGKMIWCQRWRMIYPGIAQIGSALEWGSRGRRFDSCYSDQSEWRYGI